MSLPEPLRFASWPVPEFRLVAAPSAPAPVGPSTEELAYARGMADGHREAAAESERRLGGVCEALAGAAATLEADRAAHTRRAEDSVYTLATAMAHQLVQREIATDPSIVRDLVRRALDVLPIDGALEVRLHPEDLAALGPDRDLFAPGGRRLDLHWVAEPSLQRGGFVIESPHRVIDGRLDQVLEAMYVRLRDV